MKVLQDEIRNWQWARFPCDEETRAAGKVCEEAGELMGAVIRLKEGRSAMSNIAEEFGDVFISLMGVANFYGFDAMNVIEARWETVRKR